jgi:hypothetical protein
MSAVQIELVLVLHALAEDQITARLLIAIHVVLIELWTPQPAKAPMPSMFNEYVCHVSSPQACSKCQRVAYSMISDQSAHSNTQAYWCHRLG